MAENLDNNQNNQGQEGSQGERTFSQAELDSIIKSRLADEKKKYADYDALKEKAGLYDQQQEAEKTDLQKANEKADNLQKELDQLKNANAVRDTRAKVAKETGVPVELLTGDTEEDCKAYAEAILKFAKPSSYPGTKPNRNNSNNGTNHSQEDESMREFARQIFGKGE